MSLTCKDTVFIHSQQIESSIKKYCGNLRREHFAQINAVTYFANPLSKNCQHEVERTSLNKALRIFTL